MQSLLCMWVLCSVVNHEIVTCGSFGSGSQQEMAKASAQANQAGLVFNAECKREGEEFSIDWKKKHGLGKPKGE